MSDLTDAKAGDYVAVFLGGWYGGIEKRQIKRTTKTIIELDIGGRYNRRGYVPGAGGFRQSRIDLWDEQKHGAELAEFARNARIRRLWSELRNTRWDALPLETLEAIYAMTKKKEDGK